MKTGPLTHDELMQLWASVTDREYNKPLLEKQNSNIEAIQQAAEQFARVSESIDLNTQSMFILPWSGQTAPPASGPANARTKLTLTRSDKFDIPLVFTEGEIVVQHRMTDSAKGQGEDITTNRLYVVDTTAVLGVGESGPLELSVTAVNTGPGYNAPTPGTLKTILQPGVGFNNGGASVVNGGGSTNRVITVTVPDVPITGHIGQYLYFTSGANAGRYGRVNGVENADPSVPHGGVFNLAAEAILVASGVAGTFEPGERVRQSGSLAEGLFLSFANGRFHVLKTRGVFDTTNAVTGEMSGAVATIVAKEQSELLVPETATAGWRIVDWAELAIMVTNEAQPTGGLSATLDELGNERKIRRFSTEVDDDYRRRIAVPADVVSPNAVTRAGNKVVEPIGETVCLREVGYPLLPGMFYDGAPSEAPFAFDLDLVEMTMLNGNQFGSGFAFYDAGPAGFFDYPAPQFATNLYSDGSPPSWSGTGGAIPGFIPGEYVSALNADGHVTSGIAQFDYVGTVRVFRGVVRVRGPGFGPGQILRGRVSTFEQKILTVGPGLLAQHRFNTYLNLREFRGFFLVGVPRTFIDDFGVFYDAGADNAYDANTIDNAYDGAARGSNSLYSRVWNAVNGVRPAGVPFDIYIEDIGCI
jgi:hypothetical protein